MTESSCQFRLPWRKFDEGLLPAFTQRVTAWGNMASNWATAYHGMRLEELAAVIRKGQLVKGPSMKRYQTGVFCFKSSLVKKAYQYARWVPLFLDGFFWRATWELKVDRTDSNFKSIDNTDQWCIPDRSVRLVALIGMLSLFSNRARRNISLGLG